MLGNALALLGAWMAAAYLVVGRRVRETVNTMVYVYVVYSAAAIFLITTCLVTQQPLFGYTPHFYLWAFLLALFPQIIGHTTYNWALGYLPTTFVSISLLGEPIGTIILSFFFLKETPTLIEAVGGILLLVGIYLSSRTSQK
jgi:drug/metabolite transporter (DMT)-like permease